MSTITFTTNHGPITIALHADKAPVTVANFLTYAREGFFEGTIFHRVIKGFMIQGGGFTADMQQKETNAQIKNEANNGLLNNKGTLAMARTQDPHSATAQFFINAKNNDFLNHSSESVNGWGYCVFGEVTDGIEIVEAIENVATGNHGHHQDVPVENVIIETVTIDE